MEWQEVYNPKLKGLLAKLLNFMHIFQEAFLFAARGTYAGPWASFYTPSNVLVFSWELEPP